MKGGERYSKNFIQVSHNDSVLYVVKIIREQHVGSVIVLETMHG
jgi:hypothetical protein